VNHTTETIATLDTSLAAVRRRPPPADVSGVAM
jgi:hypothetical protein